MRVTEHPLKPCVWLLAASLGWCGMPLAALASDQPEGQRAESPSPDPSSALRITVSPDVADQEYLAQWITERHPELGTDLELPEHAQWVAIDVAGRGYDFEITVTPMRDGHSLAAEPVTVPCSCTGEQLLEEIDRQVIAAVAVLRQTPLPEPAPEPEPEPEPSVASPSPELVRDGLTATGVAGLVSLSVGGAGIIGGVAMIAIGGDIDLDDRTVDYAVRDYRPAGIISLSAGIVVAATGAVLLARDLERCTRAADKDTTPRKCVERTSTVQVSGAFSPTSVGLSLRGRF